MMEPSFSQRQFLQESLQYGGEDLYVCGSEDEVVVAADPLS